MTGTACDLYEHDENESRCLNKFDLFSLWFFEKINNNHFRDEDSLGYESILKSNESTMPDLVIIDGGIDVREEL